MNLKDIEKLKYDSRMVDINLKAQTLTQDEIKKHLDKLPDLASNAITLDLTNDDGADFDSGDSH